MKKWCFIYLNCQKLQYYRLDYKQLFRSGEPFYNDSPRYKREPKCRLELPSVKSTSPLYMYYI